MRYDNIHKRPDYLLHSASTRGDKGNPGASLRVVFGRDPLSLHQKRFFIPSQQVFSPSSAGICSLYSSYPGSSLVCLFPPLSFIHMIKGLWFTHFFRDLNKTVTNPKHLTKLVTFGLSCISCRLTIRKLRSQTELLYVLIGEVGEHVRAFASEIHLKASAPQRSSLPPQPQQTRSADQLRGRKREREREARWEHGSLVWDQGRQTRRDQQSKAQIKRQGDRLDTFLKDVIK